MIEEHSILPPSDAGRWVNCPGSVAMQQLYPDTEETEDAAEGTASHEVGQSLIEAMRVANTIPSLKVGDTASNGVEITQEIFDGAEMYADDVAEVAKRKGVFNAEYLRVEQRIDCVDIHDKSWGTPDCWLYDKVKKVLYIWDYKFGHLVVEAFENWQAINYYAGILRLLIDYLGLQEEEIDDVRVVIKIVQPRAQHRNGTVRKWFTNALELRGYINRLMGYANEVFGADPRCVTGTHCNNCSAMIQCEANQRAVTAAVDYIKGISTNVLTSFEVGVELKFLDVALALIKARHKALTAQALGFLEIGQSVVNFTTETNQGREVWKNPGEVIALGDLMGIDLRGDKPSVRTPAQARKLGIDESVIKSYSGKRTKTTKLVQTDKSLAAQFLKRK